MKIAIKISIISIFIISCSGAKVEQPKQDMSFLKLDSSKGFAGDISKAPDETKAPEELPKTGAPILFGFITVATVSTIAFAVKSKKFNF